MFHVKQTDKKQKINNEIDRFITEAVLEDRVTLKTNSIKIIEYIPNSSVEKLLVYRGSNKKETALIKI